MSFEIIAGFPGKGKGARKNWPDKRREAAVCRCLKWGRLESMGPSGPEAVCQTSATDGANRHRPDRWSSFASRAHLWFSVDRTFGSVVR